VVAAKRALIYLRPKSLLVYDELTATRSKRWEWNLHAAVPLVERGATRVINLPEASLCVTPLVASDSEFDQHDRFDPPPSSAGWRAQWHGRWRQREPTAGVRWLFHLAVDCVDPPPSVVQRGSEWSLRLGELAIAISPNAVIKVSREE
jgi:hypothetical protein